jgi:hypothetical protein
MKKLIAVFAFTAGAVNINNVYGWGEWGHMHINKAAVFALPVDMRIFFYDHIDYMVEESVAPDYRKYTIGDKEEFARHYIDLEDYGVNMNDLPKTLADAREKYPDSMLNRAGILPWYIQAMMNKLTNAMKAGRKAEILFLAADLGHYIADAHMPLHTSSNHDGQLTGQRGIHAFWESQLPELFGNLYNFYTGEAKYIEDIRKGTWAIIEHSHSLADTLLETERQLNKDFPADKVYIISGNGDTVKNRFKQPVHSTAYAKAYHEKLNGMVEKQMRSAISEFANYLYTAWVNAGKPDLNKLDDRQTIARNKTYLEEDMKEWRAGKLSGLTPSIEFPQ